MPQGELAAFELCSPKKLSFIVEILPELAERQGCSHQSLLNMAEMGLLWEQVRSVQYY